jgi:probable F420-dependent oxidoreductase
MQLGAHYSLGVGFTPTAEDYVRVAQRAEELGYHSLWLADHVVVPKKIDAPYPWTEDGSVGFPLHAPFPDPLVLLSYIAAKTRKILLGTSVLIVPYRNPLHVAKAVATVDMVSGGRFLFGVGVGWLKEEFDAVGENFSERGKRTREYIRIMKALWQGGPVSFAGNFFNFPEVYAMPTPVQKPYPPIIFGGESLAAIKRVADLGDGWQPGSMPLEVFRERLDQLKELMVRKGRDFSCLSIAMVSSPDELKQKPELLSQLNELGVGQLILAFTGATAQDTISQLEDAARVV